MKPNIAKRIKIICAIVILLMSIYAICTKIYSKFVYKDELQVDVKCREVKIYESDIVVTPQEWTDKVNVTITTAESLCKIQYKVGEDGEWVDYEDGGFEVDKNITIYARLVYENSGYANQIMQETSKSIINIDDIPPTVEMASTRLADVVNVGDYVAYDATSGGEYTYTTDSTLTGSTTQSTFSSADDLHWKVLSVDKGSGIIELVSETTTASTLTLYGKTGYKNAIDVLNGIGAIYGHGVGAISGRSITIEDVNKLENYTPSENQTSNTYTSGTFINDDGTEQVAGTRNPVTISYTKNTESESTNAYYSYETTNFGEKTFWLASHMTYMDTEACYYMLRFIQDGKVENNYNGDLYVSTEEERISYKSIIPVVTLQTNIQTTGKDENGAWVIQDKRSVTGIAKDNESGIVGYQYSTDGTLTKDSEGWTVVDPVTSIEAPEYETENYGTYYFYAKDKVGNVSKAEITTGKLIASTKIGEKVTYYTSLQDAITGAGTSEATVTLLENTTELVTIDTGQNIILNLNGNILENSNGNIITNNGILTVKDDLKTGIMRSNVNDYVAILNYSQLNIITGRLEGGNGINNASGTCDIYGGTIKGSDGHSAIWNQDKLNVMAGRLEGGIGINSLSVSSETAGISNIQGGMIKGTTDEGIRAGTGTITIGNKDGNVSTSVPLIQGNQKGIDIASSVVANFYDGILKGITSTRTGTIADVESNYETTNSTETINNQVYQTEYLKLKEHTITYNTNYNLISNGDFSNGTTDWTKNGAGVYSVDTSKKYNGLNSLKISSSTTAFDGIYHSNVDLQGNTMYKQSISIYNDGGLASTKFFRLYFQEYKESNEHISDRYFITYTYKQQLNNWNKISAYYTTDGEASYCIPRADYNNANVASYLWIADIRLEEIAKQETKTHYDKLNSLPTPSRSGYTFLGWYTEETGGTEVTTDTEVTGDVEYYAHWEVNTGPQYLKFEIKNVTTTGYDVYVYGVTGNASGIDRVQFPTWTTNGGQDDIQTSWPTNTAAKGTLQSDGTTWVYRVNVADHKNEAGEYNTHVYIYGKDGTVTRARKNSKCTSS